MRHRIPIRTTIRAGSRIELLPNGTVRAEYGTERQTANIGTEGYNRIAQPGTVKVIVHDNEQHLVSYRPAHLVVTLKAGGRGMGYAKAIKVLRMLADRHGFTLQLADDAINSVWLVKGKLTEVTLHELRISPYIASIEAIQRPLSGNGSGACCPKPAPKMMRVDLPIRLVQRTITERMKIRAK